VDALTTFTDQCEFERAAPLLDTLGIEHALISPEPAYQHVRCPAIALKDTRRAQSVDEAGLDSQSAGRVESRPPSQAVPAEVLPSLHAEVPQGS
jgi:hypothetical protein